MTRSSSSSNGRPATCRTEEEEDHYVETGEDARRVSRADGEEDSFVFVGSDDDDTVVLSSAASSRRSSVTLQPDDAASVLSGDTLSPSLDQSSDSNPSTDGGSLFVQTEFRNTRQSDNTGIQYNQTTSELATPETGRHFHIDPTSQGNATQLNLGAFGDQKQNAIIQEMLRMHGELRRASQAAPSDAGSDMSMDEPAITERRRRPYGTTRTGNGSTDRTGRGSADSTNPGAYIVNIGGAEIQVNPPTFTSRDFRMPRMPRMPDVSFNIPDASLDTADMIGDIGQLANIEGIPDMSDHPDDAEGGSAGSTSDDETKQMGQAKYVKNKARGGAFQLNGGFNVQPGDERLYEENEAGGESAQINGDLSGPLADSLWSR
ncbi:uncharacterized protein I303_104907 [Kwoniella dejecticola CBS 10117]|uniref:Uncharacterized protein n=1 Tax=Kwoniella dejecticola CBS 10117 TaxID=1296121 RepID=A0A1A6A406_9TREE|nr:uncharacterized protein I303_05647 [Kwoniella dejecticola CBS 10117]OBR84788.1 hypothetical protein I303_05647 [Kwoniella dejecticola CBS 10117]